MQNYRPTVLLQVFCKLLAGMIKNTATTRVRPMDPTIRMRFSPQEVKSTSYFHSKKIIGFSRQQHSNLSLILLDWENAFDKVNQTKLLQVLRRLKVPPPKYVAVDCWHVPRSTV